MILDFRGHLFTTDKFFNVFIPFLKLKGTIALRRIRLRFLAIGYCCCRRKVKFILTGPVWNQVKKKGHAGVSFYLCVTTGFDEFEIHAMRQRAKAGNSAICYRKTQIDVSL